MSSLEARCNAEARSLSTSIQVGFACNVQEQLGWVHVRMSIATLGTGRSSLTAAARSLTKRYSSGLRAGACMRIADSTTDAYAIRTERAHAPRRRMQKHASGQSRRLRQSERNSYCSATMHNYMYNE